MATLFGICSALFVIVINITSAQSACKTPDNWNGNCIALQQCHSLHRMMQNDPTPEQRTFLSNSQCGHDGNNNVLVCCPNTFTIDDLPSGKNCETIVHDKIVGGERAGLTEFPWLALLHYTRPNRRGGSFACGGSLIHENYVLTAAHCVRDTKIIRQRLVIDSVRLGENDLRDDPDCLEGECVLPVDDVPVAEVIVHEKYNLVTFANDIALIRLQRPPTFTNSTQTVCLPIGDLQNRNHDGAPMTVAGFGRTETGFRSQVKLKVKLNGVNWAECVNTYRQRVSRNLNSNVICAGGEEGKDSCNGDSGGPLVAEATKDGDSFSYLVGIVSNGPAECGEPDFPGVYTRVDKYLDWILDHMKK